MAQKRVEELLRKAQDGELSAVENMELAAYFKEQSAVHAAKGRKAQELVVDKVLQFGEKAIQDAIEGLSPEEFNLLPPTLAVIATFVKQKSGIGKYEMSRRTGRFKVETPKSSPAIVQNVDL